MTFVNDCEYEGMEECVLDNLFQLDVEAQCIISDEEVAVEEEEEAILNEIFSTENIHFPLWWTSAQLFPGMVEECDTVLKLLNSDEFQTEIISLALRGLQLSDYWRNIEVKKATVAAIGPSVFFLRAGVKDYENNSDDSILKIVDIPYSFNSGVMEDSKSFRSAVLNCIASASDIS